MKAEINSQNSWKFVASFGCCLLMLVSGYGLWFRYQVMRDPTVVPVSYKQMLLAQIPGPRLLIESGSNGLHAFDPALVESLTGYPTLILADHAGASLHDKVERLWRYAVSGDIILLPLEWNYYHSPDLSQNHLRSMLDLGRGYFYSLSLWQRWKRAFETPLGVVVPELTKAAEARDTDYFEELQRLQFFHDHHFLKAPNGEAVIGEETRLLAKDSDCDAYILPEFSQGPISSTREFRRELRSLAKLQRARGVKVILTAPVVVGIDCYAHYGDALEPMVRETERLCNRLGLDHLLDFRRYALPATYLLDTHFHINREGSEVLTPLMIGDLVEAGSIKPKKLLPGQTVAAQIPAILKAQHLHLFSEKMPLWKGNPTALVDGDDRGQFYFGEDWYEEENWGRWARGKVASILVRPDPHFQYTGIYVNATYFNGTQKTRVYLNDQLIAEQDFTENHLIKLEKPLAEYLGANPLAIFRFESTDLMIPRTLDGSNDDRALKFGLHSLEMFHEAL